MVMITVYTIMLSDGEMLVEACWKALEILRSRYGITVFMEVVNTSLLSPGGNLSSIVLVGDKIVSSDDTSNVEDLAETVVEAVLESMVRGGGGSALAPHSSKESWEVEDVALVDI